MTTAFDYKGQPSVWLTDRIHTLIGFLTGVNDD